MSFIPNQIFNPTGNDNTQERTIIKGNTTGLFNLNNTKYSWAKLMYTVMIGNFWVPEKISGLNEDSIQYKQELTEGEKKKSTGKQERSQWKPVEDKSSETEKSEKTEKASDKKEGDQS